MKIIETKQVNLILKMSYERTRAKNMALLINHVMIECQQKGVILDILKKIK